MILCSINVATIKNIYFEACSRPEHGPLFVITSAPTGTFNCIGLDCAAMSIVL